MTWDEGEAEAVMVVRRDLESWPAWILVEAALLFEDRLRFTSHMHKDCPVCAGWKSGTRNVLDFCPVGIAAMVLASVESAVYARVDWTGVDRE